MSSCALESNLIPTVVSYVDSIYGLVIRAKLAPAPTNETPIHESAVPPNAGEYATTPSDAFIDTARP